MDIDQAPNWLIARVRNMSIAVHAVALAILLTSTGAVDPAQVLQWDPPTPVHGANYSTEALVFNLEPAKIRNFTAVWSSFETACTLPDPGAQQLFQSRWGKEHVYFLGACKRGLNMLTAWAGWVRERKEWTRWMWDLAVVSPTPIGTEWWPYGGKYERTSVVNGMPAPWKVLRTAEEVAVLRSLQAWFRELAPASELPCAWEPKGFFYYPPQGWREWHTNRNVPGWRMYLTLNQVAQGSYFSYKDFRNGTVVHLAEDIAVVRLFKVPRPAGGLQAGPFLWHAIHSEKGRWSFGINLDGRTAQRVVEAAGESFYDHDAHAEERPSSPVGLRGEKS